MTSQRVNRPQKVRGEGANGSDRIRSAFGRRAQAAPHAGRPPGGTRVGWTCQCAWRQRPDRGAGGPRSRLLARPKGSRQQTRADDARRGGRSRCACAFTSQPLRPLSKSLAARNCAPPGTAQYPPAGSPKPQSTIRAAANLLTPFLTRMHTPTPTRTLQSEDLVFRQAPTFEDCFPASTKEYKTVEHNGETLQVCAYACVMGTCVYICVRVSALLSGTASPAATVRR